MLVTPVFLPARIAHAYLRGGAADSVGRLIPAKPVVVEILSPRYSKEVEALAVRMEATARRNSGWFQAYTHRYGRPLPYHPRLGVTKQEYQRYLDESANTPLAVTQRATLTFKQQGFAHRWVLSGWGKLAPINGMVIDLDQGYAQNRRGIMPLLGTASPDKAPQSARLDWKWFGTFRSNHKMGDVRVGGQELVASLHMGPLRDGQNVGIYWSYRRFNGGKQLDDEFLLLRFAEPK
jgi:hypothetical protein